ncbi:MAG: MGMT family protein [Bacillales bacterium]|nr:MGMT family protein [Bacillales bacterium]
MTNIKDKVFALVKKIPKGKVTTYNEIAKALGNPEMRRAVGNVLHSNMSLEYVPCYRVVNSKGHLARNYPYGGVGGQRDLLKNDGIEIEFNNVDLKRYMFYFDEKDED